MTCIHVTTQAELDAALAAAKPCIHLKGDGEFEISSYDSSTVRAYDSSTVTAYDSSTVTASDSSTVRASQYTAVHKLSPRADITSTGHIITPPNLDGADTPTWLAYHGIESDENGTVTLYKAVDDAYTTHRRADYSPGATPEAEDWKPDNQCGGGLHFGPTPVHALDYHRSATKFMACPVRVDEISVIDQQKVKARRVVAPGCSEVDIDGAPVKQPEPAAAE